MNSVRTRLGVYTLVLAAAFGGAYALGAVSGSDADTDHGTHGTGTDGTGGTDDGHDHGTGTGTGTGTGGTNGSGSTDGSSITGSSGGTDLATSGLSASVGGYRLVLVDQRPDRVAFRIDAPDGRPLTTVDEVHGADLHLLAVRRDLTGFQHVHPTVDSDGVWRVDVDLATPGAWRLVAEVQPAATGAPIALGVDVLVPGPTEVEPLPEPVPLDDTSMLHLADGQMVHRTGLRFEVSPTDGLEPYLGQSAHLVAVRAGDVAVTHLHPLDDRLGTYEFAPTLPGPGTYRIFLQVQRDGMVVTFPFTIAVP